MYSCVTSKNVKWCYLIWPTLYMLLPIFDCAIFSVAVIRPDVFNIVFRGEISPNNRNGASRLRSAKPDCL